VIPESDPRREAVNIWRTLAAAGIGLTAVFVAGCGGQVHPATAAKSNSTSVQPPTATPVASQPDAIAACTTFARAFRQFTQDGDLRSYLQATSNLDAPNDIRAAIAKFNGDVAVYAVATKHRVTLATLQKDAEVIKKDCGG
jgi:hypothetical protein